MNHTKVTELQRWYTLKSGDEQISVKQNVDCMKENQNNILYIFGKNIEYHPTVKYFSVKDRLDSALREASVATLRRVSSWRWKR
eukprot:888483-Heterocapsa_arctica.AAC.1